jgi:hypothetical protein
MTELYSAAVFQGALWLGGNSNGLWRMPDMTWAEWLAFDGVNSQTLATTSINDMWVPSDGSALYIAATATGGATIYRLETAAPGGFVWDSTEPIFAASALRFG